MLESLHALAASRGEDFAPDYNALLQISSLWGDTGEELDENVVALLEEGLALALEGTGMKPAPPKAGPWPRT